MPAIINKDKQTTQIKQGKFTNTGLDKKKTTARGGAMMTELTKWKPTHKELSLFLYPTRGSYDTPTPNKGSKIDHKTLLDQEATMAIDIFKAGMLSGYTSRIRPWFKLGIFDLDLMDFTPVKLWLDRCTEILLNLFQRSNVYDMFGHVYAETATFGTACSAILEDFENSIRARTFTNGEYSLATDDQGHVNAFHRAYWMTAGQMVKKFKIENCSQNVQQVYLNNKPDTWHKVFHLVEPNDDRIPFLKDYMNMEYRSIYWEGGSDVSNSYLRLGGYEEFPFVAPRIDRTTSADVYGRGSGWKALGAIKGLQKMMRNKYVGLDKTTDPPMQRDASVVGEVNTLPGGITTFSALLPNAGLKPAYEVQLNLGDLETAIEKTKTEINRYFFADLFRMLLEAERQGREITATEIMEKQAERLSLLQPVLENYEEELTNPTIDRAFNIANRLGLLPPPPPEIEGQEIKIQYVSVLAQAQKMAGITAIEQWANGIINLAEVHPPITDLINFDEYGKLRGDMLGVPAKVTNSPERMAALRKAREKAQAEADAQQKAMALAEATKNAGSGVKNMAQAPMGQDSALDATLAGIKGQQGQQ